MHGAGAPKCYQRKLPRIMTALNRNHTDGLFHVGVHHANDAGGKLFKRQVTMIFLEPLGNNLLCARQVELKVAAKKLVGWEAAQQQVSVGDRGAFALAITDWTGISASRFGAHTQSATSGKARQRAAA